MTDFWKQLLCSTRRQTENRLGRRASGGEQWNTAFCQAWPWGKCGNVYEIITKELLMADLDCQLDWIWNRLTNKGTRHTWKGFSWSGFLKKEDLFRRIGPLSGSQRKGGTEGSGEDLVLVSLSSCLAGEVFTLLLLLLLCSFAGIRSQLHHNSKWTGDAGTPGMFCSSSVS